MKKEIDRITIQIYRDGFAWPITVENDSGFQAELTQHQVDD